MYEQHDNSYVPSVTSGGGLGGLATNCLKSARKERDKVSEQASEVSPGILDRTDKESR